MKLKPFGESDGVDSQYFHFLTLLFRPKGDHVDVKTIGQDEDSGIG